MRRCDFGSGRAFVSDALLDATRERTDFPPFPDDPLNRTVSWLESELTRVGFRCRELVSALIAKPQRRTERRDIDKELLSLRERQVHVGKRLTASVA